MVVQTAANRFFPMDYFPKRGGWGLRPPAPGGLLQGLRAVIKNTPKGRSPQHLVGLTMVAASAALMSV